MKKKKTWRLADERQLFLNFARCNAAFAALVKEIASQNMTQRNMIELFNHAVDMRALAMDAITRCQR